MVRIVPQRRVPEVMEAGEGGAHRRLRSKPRGRSELARSAGGSLRCSAHSLRHLWAPPSPQATPDGTSSLLGAGRLEAFTGWLLPMAFGSPALRRPRWLLRLGSPPLRWWLAPASSG